MDPLTPTISEGQKQSYNRDITIDVDKQNSFGTAPGQARGAASTHHSSNVNFVDQDNNFLHSTTAAGFVKSRINF